MTFCKDARLSRPRATLQLSRTFATRFCLFVVFSFAGLTATGLLASAAQAQQRPTVTEVQLVAATGSIDATWDVSQATSATGFRLRWHRTTQPSSGWSKAVELPPSARSYTITGLATGGYEVRVRALGAGHRLGGASKAAVTLTGAEGEPPLEGGEEGAEEEGSGVEEEAPVEEAPELEEGPLEESGPGEQEGAETQHGKAASVSATPAGPANPSGGWSVVYADAFGAPLGTAAGDDNTWFPNNCSTSGNCTAFNSNETEVMNPDAVSQSPGQLKLTCTYTAAAQSPGGKHYVCGTARGLTENVSGYRFFKWAAGKGQTLVFQIVAKLPENTGEADPGFWSDGPPWNDTEFDFFEAGGWGSQHTTGWKTDALYTAWFASPHIEATKFGFSFDPVAAYHTYTTEIFPDGTFSEWIDGALQPWATRVGPASPDLQAKDGLVLSYGLRTCAECKSGFTSGSREFDVKSVAVYEDAAHKGTGIEGGGIAPGTAVG